MRLQMNKSSNRRVARRTVEALEKGGYKCCLFGSAACSLWGDESRVPNDLDIVVFTDDDIPDIQNFLVSVNDRFCLVDGRHGNYQVLYYMLCWSPRLRCKVDILTPGENPLGIPKILSHCIKWFHGIPVMPFFPLLVLKVQGWRDHRQSAKPWFRRKVPQDIQDIGEMLDALDHYDDHIQRFGWLPGWFRWNAQELVQEYASHFPRTKRSWRAIGFNV